MRFHTKNPININANLWSVFLIALVVALIGVKNLNAHEITRINCTNKGNSEWWLKMWVHIPEINDELPITAMNWITSESFRACAYSSKPGCGWTSGRNFSYGTNFYKAESKDDSLLVQELFVDRLKGEAILFVNYRPANYTCALQTPKF